jgi:GNAT superfamily N-acetyltransferase
MPGVQLVDQAVEPAVDDAAVVLGPDDVEEMTDLVRRTRPGPFERRTVTLGTYLGFRDRGTLVAMAGERLLPPGYTEISAVCTDPDHRGRGYAARLVRAVAAGIRARGEVPFLHTTASNTPAIRLYEQLGFELRARPDFVVVRVPDADADADAEETAAVTSATTAATTAATTGTVTGATAARP